MKNRWHIPVWFILLLAGILPIGCVADPWPEPDDMTQENQDESSGDDKDENVDEDKNSNKVPEELELDSEIDTETGSEMGSEMGSETDSKMDTPSADRDIETADDTGGHDWDALNDTDAYSDITTKEIDDGEVEVITDDSSDGESADSGVEDDAGAIDENELSRLDQVYCSAPDSNGLVTIVGLSGTILMKGEVTVVRGNESISIPVGTDGGFTIRMEADPGEVIDLVVRFADSRYDVTRALVTGTRVTGANLTAGIMGNTGSVKNLADDGQVILHGEGEGLAAGHLVIGGNLDFSTGRVTPVSCGQEGCSFDLLIPGEPGQAIDLFMVPLSQHAGNTDVETLVIPPDRR